MNGQSRALITTILLGLMALPGFAQSSSPSMSGSKPRPAPRASEFPDAWYIYGPQRPPVFRRMEGQPAPKLTIGEWFDEQEVDVDDLLGKVVVVDFWATWCGPCVRALPENIKLVEDYKDRDLVVIGIHDARNGWNKVPALHKKLKLNYPIARDQGGTSARAWKLSFWPTYGVIDRKGILRAVGLVPSQVKEVVKKIMEEDPPEDEQEAAEPEQVSPGALDDALRDDPDDSVFDSMLEGTAAERQRLAELMNEEAPPALSIREWLNTEPLALEDLKGKVVLLDFWATWCGPCMAAVPKLNALQKQHEKDGLVVIGVCHPRGAEKMKSTVMERGIEYAVGADKYGLTQTAYKPNGYPDYYLIDRRGRLRVADCRNDKIADAVRILLAEEAPEASETP